MNTSSPAPTPLYNLPQGPDDARAGWREPAWLRKSGGPRAPLPFGGPVMWWALVLVLALLSFYVYVLQEQVWRGEQLRQSRLAQGSAPARQGAPAAPAQQADAGGEPFDLQMPPALQLRVGASR